MEQTADEARAQCVDRMGRDLGEIYAALWQEVAGIHSKWAEYVVLYGTRESRVDLLNRAAPRFARLVQDTLWEDVVLHIARLTDPPKSKGKSNLTVQSLAEQIDNPETNSAVRSLVERAIAESEFCRDWRNRHLAHRDLQLALGRGAEVLKLGSRQSVRTVLGTLGEILNVVASHYLKSKTCFEFGSDAGGALSLLHVLDDGLLLEGARRERLRQGRVEPDDYRPKDI